VTNLDGFAAQYWEGGVADGPTLILLLGLGGGHSAAAYTFH